MRASRLEIRLTADERELDAAGALVAGESLSEFFRRAARERATRLLEEQRRIALTDDEAERFLDALDRVDPRTVESLRGLNQRADALTRE
jgi:uncharacterized protein (DUF1778 family)